MRRLYPYLRPIGVAVTAFAFLASCASQVQVDNTLPQRLKDQISRIDPEAGVQLEYIPVPAGEQISLKVGAMDYTLNRVFQGMLREMLTTKFDTLSAEAENRVKVNVNYLNLNRESYGNSINRVDMAVTVELQHGYKTHSKEFELSTSSDVEGYSVPSGEIRNMLLQFALRINDYIDENWSRTQT